MEVDDTVTERRSEGPQRKIIHIDMDAFYALVSATVRFASLPLAANLFLERLNLR
jgi:hypothetical protein